MIDVLSPVYWVAIPPTQAGEGIDHAVVTGGPAYVGPEMSMQQKILADRAKVRRLASSGIQPVSVTSTTPTVRDSVSGTEMPGQRRAA
ncbi:hypothetical protein [Azospirillum sp. TSH64]|uniref:hypothetical protein n=1 Tax=Azospirillum sp. TSH64 TaxID=652740 RepID=UPI0011B1F32C|nr:hypothetical protein [Azospirillum sp. TSH64]